MLKFSPLLLLLTIPFLPASAYLGLPFWAWASLGATLVYAIVLILAIEYEWDEESTDG
jgi:hypothetical protein